MSIAITGTDIYGDDYMVEVDEDGDIVLTLTDTDHNDDFKEAVHTYSDVEATRLAKALMVAVEVRNGALA